MELVFVIFLVAVLIILLLFRFAMQINFVFNSDTEEAYMTLLWLYPFINIFVTVKNALPLIKVYLFKQLIFEKTLKNGKIRHKVMDIVESSNPKDINVSIDYGFKDPFVTGIACGAINMASQFINIDNIEQTPDFMSANDYIYLNGNAKVNLGSTLVRYIRSKQ